MRAELQVFLLGLSTERKLRPASRELVKGISVLLASVRLSAEDFTFVANASLIIFVWSSVTGICVN